MRHIKLELLAVSHMKTVYLISVFLKFAARLIADRIAKD